VKYCNNCLQTDTRPNIRFDDHGVCPACNYHASLLDVDFEVRKEELAEIIAFGKEHNHSGYDCIIGVSGGKDSTRQAIFVRESLGMNPLLVSLSYPPEQLTQMGVDNVSNLIRLGFDCISISPAPQTWRALMRKSFIEHTNWCKSTELALYSSVPRIAIAYQIPLIWWGENNALQVGDLGVMGNGGADGNNLRNMDTLDGGDITWLLSNEIKKNQILQYVYPSNKEMQDANLQIKFLGYFWKDWSLLDNANFSTLRGLQIRNNKPWEIGDPWGVTALDEDWVNLNQMIKYLKFGFGRTSDYVNEDIRNGRITREEGIALCNLFDGTYSASSIEAFSDYIGITVNKFWAQVDKSFNKELFIRKGLGKYKPRFKVGEGL